MRVSTVKLVLSIFALAALAAGQVAGAQAGSRLPVQLTIEPTGVFGVGRADLGGYTVASAVPDPSRGAVYVAGSGPNGQGYVAAVGVGGSVLWSQTLEGPGLLVALDNQAQSKWLAVASQLGDVAVVDLDSMSFYAYYYRALRSEPASLYVVPGSQPRIVALDSSGALYVFKPPVEGWFEMSLEPGQATLTYQPGVGVSMAAPLEVVSGLWNRSAASEALALVSSWDPDYVHATLNASVYYVYSSGSASKAVTGTWTYSTVMGTINETRTLRMWIVDVYFHSPETLSGNTYPIEQTEGNGDLVVEGLFPSRFYVYTEYTIHRVNIDTQEESFECYTNFTSIDLPLKATLNINIYLNFTADNPDACAAERSKHVNEAGSGLGQAVIAYINTADLPEDYNPGSDLTFRYIPVETGDVGFIEAYTAAETPPGWSVRGARYLLLVGSADSLYVYLLNNDMVAVNLSTGVYEKVYLGAAPEVVEVSPTLDRLYIGTSDGKVYELTWSTTRFKYVLTGSLVVSPHGGPVTSLKLASNTLLLAATADGAAQLVDTDAWRPLWRGPALYPAMLLSQAVGVPGAEIGGLWYYPNVGLVGYLTGVDKLMLPRGPGYLGPLYPVYATLSATLATLNGTLEDLDVNAESSYIEAYRDGSLAARLYFTQEGGQVYATLYLPSGPVKLRVNATIGGKPWAVDLDFNVEESVNDLNITIRFREVRVTVYTPDTGDIGYKLVAGPKEGALVTLSPTGTAPGVPYTPVNANPVEGVTGPDGAAYFTILDGVSYRAEGELNGYTITPVDIDAFGPQNVTLTANPTLYTVNVEVVDSEVLRYSGSKYYVPGVNLTLTLAETGRTAWTVIQSGRATLRLPAGDYLIQAAAEHYYPNFASATVPGSGVVSIQLDPTHYSVVFKVVVDDETGLAAGPAGNVKVTVTPIDFPLPPISDYTGPDGAVYLDLHWGEYNVTVEHSMLEPASLIVNVASDGSFIVLVKPYYSKLNVTVVDAELASYGVLVKNALVTLTYTGPFQGGSKTVKLDSGSGVLTVPYGYYAIAAVAPAYQESTGIRVSINAPESEALIPLQPVKYTARINIYVNDPLWSLASGPLPGATVTVKIVDPPYPLPASTLVTSSDGSATFNLRRGVYMVSVSHYLIGNYTAYIYVTGPATFTLQPLPVYVNVTLHVVDSETLTEIPGAILVLHYTGAVSGEAAVRLDNGVFQGRIPAGTYTFTIAEPHYEGASVNANLVGVYEFNLTVPLQPVYQYVEVRVVSESVTVGGYRFPEAPVSGASVTLEPRDPVLESVGVSGYTATAGPDGVARLKVRVGSYVVKVGAPNFQQFTTTLDVMPTAPATLKAALKPVLSPVTIYIVDPELLPAFSRIQGTVTLTSWNGVPVDVRINVEPNGATVSLPPGFYEALVEAPGYLGETYNFTVPGAAQYAFNLTAEKFRVVLRVQLASDFGSTPAGNLTVTLRALDVPLKVRSINLTLNPDGIAIVDLRRGNYSVMATPPGYSEPLVLGYVLAGGGRGEYEFTVQAPSVTLNVTVVDSDFRNIKVPANLSLIYMGPYGSGETTVQAPRGEATLRLPPGSYQIIASSPFYYTQVAHVNATSDTNVTISLPPLLSKPSITVRDVDGNPVSGARVILRHTQIPYTAQAVTNAQGVASFSEGVRLGVYSIVVTPPPNVDYLEVYTSNITITRGQEPINIVLKPKFYAVTIVLRDKDTGEAIPFPYILSLSRKGAGSPALNIPQEVNVTNGSVTLLLPYGSYTGTLKPVKEDYYNLPQQVSFVVDANKSIDIALTPKLYSVTVTVVDDRGAPLPQATVTFKDSRGLIQAAALTDSDGKVSVQLKYGTYTIDVVKQGYKEATGTIIVPKSKIATITMEPGVTVLLKRYSIFIVGIAGLAVAGYGILRLREKIAEKLAEEEYF